MMKENKDTLQEVTMTEPTFLTQSVETQIFLFVDQTICIRAPNLLFIETWFEQWDQYPSCETTIGKTT